MRRIGLFSLLFLAVFLFTISGGASGADGESERVIVKFKERVAGRDRERTIRDSGLAPGKRTKLERTYTVRVPKNQREKFAKRLARSSFVEYAEPDYEAYEFGIPNDSYFPNQWGLSKIESEGAWDTTHGDSNVEIAILDTGVDGGHPDLSGKVVASVDCTISSSCPSVSAKDIRGHGTHVAGIAAAVTNNSLGVAGLGYDTELMSVKVLSDSGSGYYSWIADGIVWAADNGAEVINLSLGGSSKSTTLKNAVNYAVNKGVVVVAAAGNNGRRTRVYPAYYSKAIAVAATDQNDRKASFSNYGGWVDIAAPGVSVLSTYKGGYSYLSGTSMAAPHVAGLAGLLSGYHPGWSGAQIRSKIESSADSIAKTGNYWVHGRINACSAVDCFSASPEPTVTPSPTPTPTAIPTATPSPTPTPQMSPTASPTAGQAPSPTPTPTGGGKRWWCQYVPTHRLCK